MTAPGIDADGFVVCIWQPRTAEYQYEHFEDWAAALAFYDDPPGGWNAVAICASNRGVPFTVLRADEIAALRQEDKDDRPEETVR